MADDEPHAAEQAFLHRAWDELEKRLPPPTVQICDCGREPQPGENHANCYPGM